MGSFKNSKDDKKKNSKDDKQKTKSKRGFGSLLKKSSTKDESPEDVEHTELDTTE